ncbi:MAG: glycosyltransferase family 1 protein [Patescibacteria group bacterium]
MRIALDIRSLTDENITGVGVYALNLVEALAKVAPQHEFVLFASGSLDVLSRLPDFKAPNVKIVKLRLPNRLLFLLMLLTGGPKLDRFLPDKPDVWIFTKFNIFKTDLPYILTIHDLAFEIFPKFVTFKEKLHNRIVGLRSITQAAAGLLAVSESTASDLKERWQIPGSKIHVTPLGVDGQKFTQREQASDRAFRATYDLNRPYILALATQEPRKNLKSVVEAYNLYRQRHGQPLPLVLIGGAGWKNTPFKKSLADSPYAQDIHVLGYVPEKHKPALYRGAWMFVFPSFYEGFGLPVLEAMACGTPVITSATSALPEIVGPAAILIDPFNVNDLASALLQGLDSEHGQKLRDHLRAEGLKQAPKFSWEQTALLTLAALNEIDQNEK